MSTSQPAAESVPAQLAPEIPAPTIPAYLVKILRIYKRVLTNKPVKADEQSIEQNALKLTGLVKTTPSGTLTVRNRIYAKCFAENWVKESMPSDINRRIAIVSSVIAVIAIAVALYFYNQTDEIKAQNYIENFCKYEDVKIKFGQFGGAHSPRRGRISFNRS